MSLIRKIVFVPAYDEGPKFGSHGMVISFRLFGPEGVLAWDFHTRIYLEATRKRLGQGNEHGGIYGTEIYSHSTKPHSDSTIGVSDCALVGGVQCHTTSIYGQDLAERLVAEGDEGIWKRMEVAYRCLWPQLEMTGLTT